MKKIILSIVFIISFLAGCEKENSQELNLLHIREVAWNSLNNQQKKNVISDWKKAPVSETTYEEKAVYSVTFNTKDDDLLGSITVYVDSTTLVVLGYGLRS